MAVCWKGARERGMEYRSFDLIWMMDLWIFIVGDFNVVIICSEYIQTKSKGL